jgi:glutamyl-tRNA reductase
MDELKKLNKQEKEELFKAPVYFSLFAANADGKLDMVEKKAAIKLAHFKTYYCHPMLSEFRKEVDEVFSANIDQLDKQLPKGKKARENAIRKELVKLVPILNKLSKRYAAALHVGFLSYSKHVSEAHTSKLESFIFPMYVHPIIY